GYTGAQGPGQLPAGIAFNSPTLQATGTPAESGYFSAVFTFTDSASHTLKVTNSLFIGGGTSTISINNSADLGSVTVGSSYSNPLSACCVPSYVRSVTGGTVPPGLTLAWG